VAQFTRDLESVASRPVSPVAAALTARHQDTTPKKPSDPEEWALQKEKQLVKTGSPVSSPSLPAQKAAPPLTNLPPFRFVQHVNRFSDL
jgi:hypothetical protein